VAKHRTLRHDKPFEVQLPITPMLDMSFQLLAFFVMTFQASNALEGQLDMYLPKAGSPMAKAPDQVDLKQDSDVDIDKESDLIVVVTSRGGDIESLAVREKTGSTPVSDPKQLRPMLARMRAGQANQDSIKIEADGKLKYAKLVDVMDACLGAGFKSVGFAPPPDLQR
jgi:biopolymer transport protein ExbD